MALSDKERKQRCRARRIEQGNCSRCGKNKPHKNGQICRECLDKHNDWYKTSKYRDRHASIRVDDKKRVMNHYGEKCSCCGETEPCFLAIDHIGGDGNSNRKKIGKWGSGFFKWLIKNNFPEGFQILCHNCNMGKHLNGGICPHKGRTVKTQYVYNGKGEPAPFELPNE